MAVVQGDFIRKIERGHGYGPFDDTDNGAVASRLLTYVKKKGETGVRISWIDNLEVVALDACRWSIRFNGAECADPGPIAFDYGANMNGKRSQANFGTCFGLPADTYVVQVYVGAAPAGQLGDCKTGYLGQYWALEVEEVY